MDSAKLMRKAKHTKIDKTKTIHTLNLDLVLSITMIDNFEAVKLIGAIYAI